MSIIIKQNLHHPDCHMCKTPDWWYSDGEHYEPPPPPPLPVLGSIAKAGWAGVALGPLYFLLTAMLGWELGLGQALAAIAFVGGMVCLFTRLAPGGETRVCVDRASVVDIPEIGHFTVVCPYCSDRTEADHLPDGRVCLHSHIRRSGTRMCPASQQAFPLSEAP